jgi:CRP/FNR family cyclic AMP-dependent transcriptional regulator
MPQQKQDNFDSGAFLAGEGVGRRIIRLKPGERFCCQGSRADAIFYLQEGRAKLTVVSKSGKEATITIFTCGDFMGEESLAAVAGLRLATATAISACSALQDRTPRDGPRHEPASIVFRAAPR